MHPYAFRTLTRRHAHVLCAALAIAGVPSALAAAPHSPTLHTAQSATGVGLASQPARQVYTFTETDFARHRPTEMWDIARSGTAVGDFAESPTKAPNHCFLLAHNTRTAIHHPGSTDTQCQGINRRGTVVGGYMVRQTGLFTGFVYANGAFRNVSPPGAFNTVVNAINDAGVMVGTCFDPNGGHAFVYDGSRYRLIDAPRALVTTGQGINNKGEVVADAVLQDDHYHAFLIRGERFKEMRYPNSLDNQGWHINNRGEVGLDWTDIAGTQHGGVYDSARDAYYVVDAPGKASTAVLGINEEGTLAGTFEDRSGQADHGFIATADLTSRQ